MDRFFGWIFIIILGFIAVMTPVLMVVCPLAGTEISVVLYVIGFVELAGALIFVVYKALAGRTAPEELKNKMIPASVAACGIAFVLGISLAPLYKFEGGDKSIFSSSTSTSSGRTATPRATTKPKSSYSGYTSRSRVTSKPSRTVDPMDHDIDIYYDDYKDEFVDEDDAWDDFEDDDSAWDDY